MAIKSESIETKYKLELKELKVSIVENQTNLLDRHKKLRAKL
jgi:hypothetical protein